MKRFFTSILLIFSISVFAQKYTVDTDLIDQFTDSDKIHIILSASIDADGFHTIELDCDCADAQTFKLKPLTYPNFEVRVKQAIKAIITSTKDNNDVPLVPKDVTNTDLVRNRITQLFARIVTFYNTEEERPQVATIKLKNEEIPVYYNTDVKSIRKIPLDDPLKNIEVEISFFGGFIEKIQVNGSIGEENYSFNNKYSIGISSTKNIQQLSDYVLYSNEKIYRDTSDTNAIKLLHEDQYQYKKTEKKSLFIQVDDVIRYIKKVDVNANDISPVPQTIVLDKSKKESKLYREESSKLFEAVAYTDLIGLFDEESPNGLVQLEVKKRFNLNTRRYDRPWYYGIVPPFLLFEGAGVFQNADVFFQYSKIEENNKFLLPQTVGSETFYTPISLLQYRNFAVGGILNLMTFENQNSKINMFFNAGALYGRTGVKLDAADEKGVFYNNLEIPFEASIQVLPEKRVSFSFTDRLSWFETFNEDIAIRSIEKGEAVSKNRWLNSFNIDLLVDISTTGKLFLRYKLIHELDNINNNFSQLQFGYSFYILKNNGVKGKK
ncbi:hypothetical protein ATO12_02905 [Aquimarina atlantica]|uniref:Outer membrane protein beta-barrel domain-containing protein n=1 Tax=Aquimarina atlantica TaxID=1317122 RepID=A0A023C0M6_9FLAO|nr:hypothetical protein [Aquimarina atlantica]EZH75754.1 hypothetical protein ATO12_02905 [Aquimarina atlantica]